VKVFQQVVLDKFPLHPALKYRQSDITGIQYQPPLS